MFPPEGHLTYKNFMHETGERMKSQKPRFRNLRSAHIERQRPIQSQWKRQPKRQAAPLKFAACRSVWVSPKSGFDAQLEPPTHRWMDD